MLTNSTATTPNSLPRFPIRKWLFLIIGLAILLRVATALYLGDEVIVMPGTFDQLSYDMVAQQVMAGEGFTVAQLWWPATPAGEPTAHWSFLYTSALAGLYSVIGYQPLVARLFQAIAAGILLPLLAFRLGQRLYTPEVGLVAAGLAAVYAYFVYYAAALMTETFYIIAILWVLDLAVGLSQGDEKLSPPRPPLPVWERGSRVSDGGEGLFAREKTSSNAMIDGLLLGVALAITLLLRQVFLLFLPFLFGWLLWRSLRGQAKPLLAMLITLSVATVVIGLTIAPWTIRNYRVFEGQFVLLNTNAGFAFFWGNHPIHGYNFVSILPNEGPSYQELIPAELLTLNEAELDRALLQRGLGFIKDDPVRYVILSITRIRDYFKFWPSSDSGMISNISRMFSFGLMLPLMLYGLIISFRRALNSPALILYLFVVSYTGVHILTWALVRYRLPVDAILLIFAGVAVVDLQARVSRIRKSPTPTRLHSGDNQLKL